MSDTELLMLAAKAAGYPVEVVGDQVWINGDYQAVTNTRPWWPLTDDGDAFRLLCWLQCEKEKDAEFFERRDSDDDFNAAWDEFFNAFISGEVARIRRAIVVCVARLGKEAR